MALNFAVALGNETTVVPSNEAGAGRQQATAPAQNQLSATYSLTQIGIRRRARFGPDAGVWTDLLAPTDSEIGGLDDLLNDADLSVSFSSAVRFRWEADVIRDDAIDPRRLLVNAETPYTFLTGNSATEEGLLANDPSFPCCSGKRSSTVHVLDFASLPPGVRTPAVQLFTESTSTMRWLLPRPPVVAAAVGSPAGVPVARVLIASTTDQAIEVVTFDEPAFVIDIGVFWRPVHVAELGSALVVEAVRGLEVVDRQVFPLSQGSPTVPIRCRDGRGLTSVTLRYVRQAAGIGTTQPSLETLEIRNLRYRTVREERDRIADQGRCQSQGGVAGGGKLAWLPNHDYELALTADDGGLRGQLARRGGRATRRLPHTRPAGPECRRVAGSRAGAVRRVRLSRRHRCPVPPRAGVAGVRRAVQHPDPRRPEPRAERPRRPTAGDCPSPPPTGSSPTAAPLRRRGRGCRG